MPANAPPWEGERYCIGCRMVAGGVDEEGLCPECAEEWAKKMVIDAAQAAYEQARAIDAAKKLMPGLSDRQIKRLLKKGRFVG